MRTWWGPYIHFLQTWKCCRLSSPVAARCRAIVNDDFSDPHFPFITWHTFHPRDERYERQPTSWHRSRSVQAQYGLPWRCFQRLQAASCICYLSVSVSISQWFSRWEKSHENADYYHAHLKRVRLISRVLVSEFEHKPETACSRTPRKHQGPAERAHTRPSRSTMKHDEVYQFLLLPWSVPNFYCV